MAVYETSQLEAGLTVAQLLTRWPQTIAVFTRHHMACVGCPIAAFETVAEVAAIYHLDLPCFVAELQQAIALAKINQTH